jgi:integrase
MNTRGANPTLYRDGNNWCFRYVDKDGKRKFAVVCPINGQGAIKSAIERDKRKMEMLAAFGLVQGEMSPEIKASITFGNAAHSYIQQASQRRRKPLKPATSKSYYSYLTNHLLPTIGELPLAQVTNKSVKELIAALDGKGLSPKTIVEVVGLVKIVVASIVDGEGAPLYPRTWSHEFMDMPIVGKQSQVAFEAGEIEQYIARAKKRESVLYALLAGTGLRIGEALAIRISGTDEQTVIAPDCRTIYVKKSIYGSTEQEPKTRDAIRDVDVAPELATFIRNYIGSRKDGYLFCSDSGKPLLQRNILRDSLHTIQRGREARQTYREVNGTKVKHIYLEAIPAVRDNTEGFHAFRRYRATHLDLAGVPNGIKQFWLGHADKSITDRYIKMKGRVKERQEWAVKAGLGFKLPGQLKVVGKPKGKVKAA